MDRPWEREAEEGLKRGGNGGVGVLRWLSRCNHRYGSRIKGTRKWPLPRLEKPAGLVNNLYQLGDTNHSMIERHCTDTNIADVVKQHLRWMEKEGATITLSSPEKAC